MAVLNDKKTKVLKATGKVRRLEDLIRQDQPKGSIGIGHTRWATHGPATVENAHPHRAGKIALVHNGIIENYKELKQQLKSKGQECVSETDSEVLAHLISQLYGDSGNLTSSVQDALQQVEGTYGLVVTVSYTHLTLPTTPYV